MTFPSFTLWNNNLRCFVKSDTFENRSIEKNMARIFVTHSYTMKVPNILQIITKDIETVLDCVGKVSVTRGGVVFPIVAVKNRDGHKQAIEILQRQLSLHGTKFIKDNNLQSLIIGKLKNQKYRLHAALYYTESHSTKATLDVLDQVDTTWTLRV